MRVWVAIEYTSAWVTPRFSCAPNAEFLSVTADKVAVLMDGSNQIRVVDLDDVRMGNGPSDGEIYKVGQ